MIEIDSREHQQHPDIKDYLEKAGIEVNVRTLPVADFRVIGEEKEIIVERKAGTDFVHSLGDGSMVDQLLRLCSVEDTTPKLLIEGSLAQIKKFSKWPDKSVMGWLVGVMEGWGIQTVFVPSLYWTKMYLVSLHKKYEGGKAKKYYAMRYVPRAKTYDEVARSILEGFPSIGGTMAVKLLEHFGSVWKVGNATVIELSRVPKIGASKAKLIYNGFRHKYGEKVDVT